MNKLINDYNAEELSDLIEKSGLNVNIKDEEGLSLIAAAILANPSIDLKKVQIIRFLPPIWSHNYLKMKKFP
jgi:hypothetical protein